MGPHAVSQDKGDEEEEDDDDDDDVMAEGEEPVMPAVRGRRDQVVAKKFEVPENWTAPVYEKSDEVRA